MNEADTVACIGTTVSTARLTTPNEEVRAGMLVPTFDAAVKTTGE